MVVISSLVTAIIGGVVAISVAMINSRASRTAPAPPPPSSGQIDPTEVRRRLDDGDEARELIDRRQERHERAMDRLGDRIERAEDVLDRNFPGWRSPHGS